VRRTLDGIVYMEVGSSGGTLRGKLLRGEGFPQGCFYHFVWMRVEGFHSSKDGGQGSGAETAVRVESRAVWLFELQSSPHISIAAMLQMRLEEEPLDLAALGLLLGFDLVERELEGAGGCQPGLQQRELNKRRPRISRETGCCRHILTVI